MTLDRAEYRDAGAWLHAFYQSADGLQRPEGLWRDGQPDWEGLGAWLLEVYAAERSRGASVDEARAAVVQQIQASDEWQQKHPGVITLRRRPAAYQSGFIRAQGSGLIDENGAPWLFAGYAAHTLISDVAKGDDAIVHALIDDMVRYGANTCVTIGNHRSDWKREFGFYHDARSADHPKVLARMLDIFAERQTRVCYHALADAQGLTRAEQNGIWQRDAAVIKDRWNVTPYSKGNEDEANGWYPGDLDNRPDVGRVLLSQGSRGGGEEKAPTPFAPNLDVAMWETRLTKDTPDFKVIDDAGAGSRELQAGYEGKTGRVPPCPLLLIIETVVFNDTNPDQYGDFRSTDPKLALKLASNIAANCAGGAFASTQSLIGRRNGPIADQCAREWFRGLWGGFVR